MIKLFNVPGVHSVNLYQIYSSVTNKEGAQCERIALFFAAPWSLPSNTYAQTLGYLKAELNVLEKKDFLQVFVVPASVEEIDEEGYK